MPPPVVDEKALLPCPFCNSAAKIWKTPNYYGVECTAKTFACVSMPACFESEQTAIEAWNTRAHVPQPNLHKLIGQMEGMKEDDTGNAMLKSHHAGIDRCIALVRRMVDHG